MATTTKVQAAFRLPATVLKRIETYSARLSAVLPKGMHISRTGVVLLLLEKALDLVEREAWPARWPEPTARVRKAAKR